MAKLNDLQIRKWIEAGEPFEGVGDGDGLYLCWPKGADGTPRYAKPFWRFRYRFDGKQKIMNLGSYGAPTLAGARKLARELRARVALGYDPAAEKRERKASAKAAAEALKHVRTVSQLTDEFFSRYVDGKLKRSDMIRQRLGVHIKNTPLGLLPVDQVKPIHIDQRLREIADTGKLRTANDILRWLKRIFDFGVTRHYLELSPASAFRIADAGGKERSRDRSLSLDEIAGLFEAMDQSRHFSRQNALAVRLLLMLGVRKMELLAAPWSEFDLEARVWHLPAARSKTETDIRIPLPAPAVDLLRELRVLACGSAFVFPRRDGIAGRDKPMAQATLNVALGGLKHGIAPFTVHDFRRTVRTQLAALNIPPHICERCLNHKIPGVAGVYDRHDYFEERKAALNTWAAVLTGLRDRPNVVPIRRKKN
jgi:integrase